MDFYEIKDKKELLAKYLMDYNSLKALIASKNPDAIDFTPKVEDAWTIREHIAHLMDNEINAFVRYRKSISDSGVKLHLGSSGLDEGIELWRYSSQDLSGTIDVMILLRQITANHLKLIIDHDWNKFTIDHPKYGIINLNFILSIYTQHYDMHLEYIQRNLRLFR